MILLQDFLEPLYLPENNKGQRRQCDGRQNNKTKKHVVMHLHVHLRSFHRN